LHSMYFFLFDQLRAYFYVFSTTDDLDWL
jgi:hypothetical protein